MNPPNQHDAGACVKCHQKIEVAIPVGGLPDSKPLPGKPCLCSYCGHVNVFGDDLKLREPLPIENLIMDAHPIFRKMVARVRKKITEYRARN